jgi:hypothetical protein
MPTITALAARAEQHDERIVVGSVTFCMVAGVIRGEVRGTGWGGGSVSPWRTGARGNKIEQQQRWAMAIMVPWPAVG